MIDSVLKGTGNSRFLKSAVPAGTSWADALAMLQAGTFPIDLNGINTEGFQQVGTPLNKANLLKDVNALTLGLTGDAVPNDMFNALAHAGDLHVWRKTVVTGTAKVELEPAVSSYIVSNNGSNYNQTIKYSSTIDEKGNLSGTITTLTVAYNTSNSDLFVLKGKYFEAGTTEISSNLKSPGGVWYIPNDASIQYITGQPNTTGYPYYYTHVATKMQKVVYVPAGTTTTYPVSTNRNAYQEGEYGKAGYTLGDVKTGTFQIGQGATTIAANRAIIKYGTSVSVTDTGTVSIASEIELAVTSDSSQAAVDTLKGKFFRFSQLPFSSSAFSVGEFYFFPANTVFTKQSSGNWYASKYQTVTSHGKTEPEYTIEYLGCLGDKARVQVVSYVGTGTYGSGHPNSLTFDFVPKAVFVVGTQYSDGNGIAIMPMIYGYGFSNRKLNDSNSDYCIVTWNKKM